MDSYPFDAKVTITNSDTNDSRTINTGEDGSYRAPGLQPGHYMIKVEKDGFKTVTQTGLTLDVTAELVVNPTSSRWARRPRKLQSRERLPSSTPPPAHWAGLVNDQQIAELPLNGRNYTDLTLLQPGISQTTHSGLGDAGLWYSSNGMSPRSNNYTLDGALTVTQNGTGPASMNGSALDVDGIKEYKIVTSMFGAEYGLLMGSQMVIVSKSGTNQFHGDVFEFLRNNHMDARNFFEAPTSLIPGPYNRLPQFQRNNFGGALGGPIRKDKTFFFLVYEGLRLSQGDTIQDTTLPCRLPFRYQWRSKLHHWRRAGSRRRHASRRRNPRDTSSSDGWNNHAYDNWMRIRCFGFEHSSSGWRGRGCPCTAMDWTISISQ